MPVRTGEQYDRRRSSSWPAPTSGLEAPCEPGPCETPIVLHGANGRPHDARGLLHGKPGEEPQLGHAGLPWTLAHERPEGFIDRENVEETIVVDVQPIVESQPSRPRSSLTGETCPCVLHEHPSHRRRG